MQFLVESVNKLFFELLSCSVRGGELQAIVNVDHESDECAIIFFSCEHVRKSGTYYESHGN
jgi:hypothetical protein